MPERRPSPALRLDLELDKGLPETPNRAKVPGGGDQNAFPGSRGPCGWQQQVPLNTCDIGEAREMIQERQLYAASRTIAVLRH